MHGIPGSHEGLVNAAVKKARVLAAAALPRVAASSTSVHVAIDAMDPLLASNASVFTLLLSLEGTSTTWSDCTNTINALKKVITIYIIYAFSAALAH
jgi:hypothetical protein